MTLNLKPGTHVTNRSDDCHKTATGRKAAAKVLNNLIRGNSDVFMWRYFGRNGVPLIATIKCMLATDRRPIDSFVFFL
jgi:hypothetical protein